jgi:hypothetical protein
VKWTEKKMKFPIKGVSVNDLKIAADDLRDGRWELVMQLALVSAVFGLGWLAWPEGLMSSPFASWDLVSVVFGSVTVLLYALGLVMLYFVVLEPVRVYVRGMSSTNDG